MYLKYNKIKNTTKILILIMAVISSVAVAISNPLTAVVNADNKLRPIYCVETERRVVSLTFDAAWGSDKTLAILDILDSYNIKVTFFLVGFWIEAHPELVREIAKRGHEIGTHSMTHPKMSQLTVDEINEELTQSVKMIEELTGNTVSVFRPPFGDYDNKLISACTNLNLYAIQWDVDSLDWKGLSAKEIAARIQKAESGSIILFHNNSNNIVQALPVVIEALIAKGLSFCPVGDLIYRSNYVINHCGKQIKTE
ncbi:MAG TPA: polysaccharide deacetylase family protein [Clostridia bacterium]|nr:polysaccharide deacetylase family protein [Clostridia bacterium]